MNIGIFIVSETNSDFRKEGLGRYVAHLLKGFLENGNDVTIACSKWLITPLDLLFEDNNIDVEKVRLITVPSPIAVSLYMWIKSKRKKKKRRSRSRLKKLMGSIAFETITAVFSLTNALVFVFLSAAILAVTLVFSPLLLLLFLVVNRGMIIRLFKKAPKKKEKKNNDAEADADDEEEEYTVTFREKVYLEFLHMRTVFFSRIYANILHNNFILLTDKINHLHCADIWYSPFVPRPEFNQIKGVKAMNVPDLVTAVFPQGFASEYARIQTDRVKQAIQQEHFFVTYSEYVKESTLIKDFAKDRDAVKVIRHAVNDLNGYIDIHANTAHMGFPREINYNFARDKIGMIMYDSVTPSVDRVRQYIQHFNMKDVRYIFYASQIRPNKNILVLLNAYEYILRKKHCQVKLILTGNYASHPSVSTHIFSKRLEYDVLSFSDISAGMLASLYASAELVVNPTLYEGGFPFTFGEGMSVGTPSVMSSIPQVTELLDGYGDCDDFLFDPYNWRDMAEKIEYGLTHRETLYTKQLRIYEEMAKRTWNDVALEYTEAFNAFVKRQRMLV